VVVEILVLETFFSRQIVRDEPRRMVEGTTAGTNKGILRTRTRQNATGISIDFSKQNEFPKKI